MKIYEVNPNDVIIQHDLNPREVAYQAKRLEKEGQIEPTLVVPLEGGKYKVRDNHPDSWLYAEAQVQAACDLGWPTILVTY